MHIPLPLGIAHRRPARQRWQATSSLQHPLRSLDTGRLDIVGQAGLLALLLGGNQSLGSLLANELDTGGGSGADGQESNLLGLGDDRETGVVAAGVALPVRVVGEVAGREGDRVVVLEGVVLAGGGEAVVGVEGDAVGAVGVEGEGGAELLPEAGGLDGVFLDGEVSVRQEAILRD